MNQDIQSMGTYMHLTNYIKQLTKLPETYKPTIKVGDTNIYFLESDKYNKQKCMQRYWESIQLKGRVIEKLFNFFIIPKPELIKI